MEKKIKEESNKKIQDKENSSRLVNVQATVQTTITKKVTKIIIWPYKGPPKNEKKEIFEIDFDQTLLPPIQKKKPKDVCLPSLKVVMEKIFDQK